MLALTAPDRVWLFCSLHLTRLHLLCSTTAASMQLLALTLETPELQTLLHPVSWRGFVTNYLVQLHAK